MNEHDLIDSLIEEQDGTRGHKPMTKKPTGVVAGNSHAIRIYKRMEEER